MCPDQGNNSEVVMPALVAGIHALSFESPEGKAWMAEQVRP
jgi:hypothetical protein